jgi:putative transposase
LPLTLFLITTLIEHEQRFPLTLLPYLIVMKVEFKNLYTHFIFSTFHREPLISEEYRERVEKYITGIVKNNDCHMYAIYANPDHVHFLVSRSPLITEETLASIVENSSARFINENNFFDGFFQWQSSCSAYSVSKGDIEKVCKYIMNQGENHKKVSCIDEYEEFLKFYQKTIRPK